MEGGKGRVKGREGGGGDGQACKHSHTNTHTHLLQFSIRDLWGGKNQLAPFLGIIGPAERGTHFHLTPNQLANSVYVRMYVHAVQYIRTYVLM